MLPGSEPRSTATEAGPAGETPAPLALSAAHSEAIAIRDVLHARAWPEDGEPHDPRVHQYFLRLYFQTTRHWLRSLEPRSDREIGFMVIRHFFGLYRACVDRVLTGQSEEVVPHWRPYFAVAARAQPRASAWQAWQLLYHGIVAHTREDLADAICLAWRDHEATHGEAPARESFRDIMLARHTDDIFREAAVAFLRAESEAGSTLAAHAPVHLAQRLGQAWLPAFQSNRHWAWREAMRRLASPSGNPSRAGSAS